MTAIQLVALIVAAMRVVELAVANRNTRALLRAGGIERGRSQYPVIVLFHALWLASLLLLIPADAPIYWTWLGVFAVLQVARVWVIASLGRFWTTRVITLPGAPLVRRGPYRFIRHPNYLVVALEIPVLPLAFGAWSVAVAFGLFNLGLLAWRIAIEERALAPRRDLDPESQSFSAPHTSPL